MKSPLIVLTALLGFALSASAQDWAKAKLEGSPRHQEWVDVKNGSRTVRCFVVYPEVSDKAPAVLVIHENKGLTDWVRDAADEFAAAGYIAIAPDLLSGAGPKNGGTSDFTSQDSATAAIYKLPQRQVAADLNATADYVKKLPSANGRLVVAGFCWGGGQSFRCAWTRKDLKAAFVFYGTGPEGLVEAKDVGCPVYGFYAGEDSRIGATIPRTTELMENAGKKYEPETYDGASHGFMRLGEDPGGSDADKEARNKAWARVKKLLKDL